MDGCSAKVRYYAGYAQKITRFFLARLGAVLNAFNRLFPVWAIALAGLAWWRPAPFVALSGAIVPLLALVMFCMGLTLRAGDFRRVAGAPRPLLLGIALQFSLMPLIAWALVLLLRLPEQVGAGLILVGCCAGGTASNVICYLARADVALSISMTMVSTLLGVVLTPALCWLYIDQAIAVDYGAMLASLVRLVLLPVLAGVAINHAWGAGVRRIEPLLPSLAIAAIVLIIAVIAALNRGNLEQLGPLVLVAVVLHNGLGMLGGYGLSRLAGMEVRASRTIAIEVGMQNSGLGVALALQHFSPLAALPGALFSIWHNITGSVLAARWARRAEPGHRDDGGAPL